MTYLLILAVRFLESISSKVFRFAVRLERLREARKPLSERLVYSAYARCPCGAGLAFDSVEFDDHKANWECSSVLLGTASLEVSHADKSPVIPFGSIPTEHTPGCQGATTRPEPEFH